MVEGYDYQLPQYFQPSRLHETPLLCKLLDSEYFINNSMKITDTIAEIIKSATNALYGFLVPTMDIILFAIEIVAPLLSINLSVKMVGKSNFFYDYLKRTVS